MKTILNLFSFVLFCQISYSQRTLTPTELQEDFALLQEQLVKRNKGLYLYLKEEDFKQQCDEFLARLNTPKTELEFKQMLERFILPIHERHLSVKGFHKTKSETGEIYKNGKAKVFPFYVKYINDSTAYIIRNASNDSTFQVPKKLLSINGKTMADIREQMAQYVMHDYGVTSRINYEISGLFASKYYEQIDTTSTFNIVCENNDKTIQKLEVSGISNKDYTKRIIEHSKKIYDVEELRPNFRTMYYDSLSTGYLKIGTFSNSKGKKKEKYKGDVLTLKNTAKDFFKTVDANNYENIIIDLRYNSGGSVSYMLKLLSYVQGVEKKTPLYKQTRKRYLSKNTTTSIGKTIQPNKHHFDGNVYILTNSGSYSASVMFASGLKAIRANVTIIGEEAGGRHDGTTAGKFKLLRLKNSGLLIRIPERKYDYFAGNQLENLKPDIEVQPQLNDFFSYDLDEVLRVTLEEIKRKHLN